MHLASSNPSRMGSPLGSWRCCGGRVTRNGSRLKACTGKACPDVPVSEVRRQGEAFTVTLTLALTLTYSR